MAALRSPRDGETPALANKLIHKLRWRHRRRKCGSESRTLYKFRRVSKLYYSRSLAPIRLADYNSLTYLCVSGKNSFRRTTGTASVLRTTKGGISNRVAISSFVDPLDEISGLLEFNREEVGRRDVDALEVNACLV